MIAPYREAGIVLDIGTGDGRFVFAAAKANPNRFYIGIDANAKPLEKRSIKITRKRAKGGMPNAMFVQAAVEDLPEELDGIASEIYVNFPWAVCCEPLPPATSGCSLHSGASLFPAEHSQSQWVSIGSAIVASFNVWD